VSMAKKTIALVIAFILLVWGAKYYQDHYTTIQPSSTNSTKKPPPTWGGDSGSPFIVPPPSDPKLQLGIYAEDPTNVSSPEVLQAINWSENGPLYPGQDVNKSIYIKNEGDLAFKLNLSTSDWRFQDYNKTELSHVYQQYFNLTWNYDNAVVAVDEVKPLALTLSISPLIENVTTFSFNIIISRITINTDEGKL